jgi:hypothetical protein
VKTLRTAVRAAALLVALLAAVAAPELPALVPFGTPAGRIAALGALTVLAATLAWGLAAAARRNNLRPLADLLKAHPIAVASGALLWLVLSCQVPAAATRTEIYRLVASWLAPLAGLTATIGAACLLAPGAPDAAETAPAAARGGRARATPLILLAALLAAGAAALVAHLAFAGVPHIPDEIAYLFDARVFAAGRRFATPPPVPTAFPAPDWIEIEPARAYGIFPPGWPRLLALGVGVGRPDLVNPLVAALTVLLAGGLAALAAPARDPARARSAPGDRTRIGTALATAWLLAASPFFVVLAASYMAHTAAALWTACALLFYALAAGLAGGGVGAGVRIALAPGPVAGLAGTLLLLTRPIEAIALFVATGADAVLARRGTLRAFTWVLLGLVLGGVLLGADQAAVTGSPWVPPVTQYFARHFAPAVNRLGFGPEVGLAWDGGAPGHSPGEALANVQRNFAALARHLGGWPAGSLFLLLVFVLAARKGRLDRLLLLHAACIVVLYALYWYHGLALGPRFLASLAPSLALFTWRGATCARDWLERAWPGRNLGARVRAALVVSVACGLLVYLPLKTVTEYRGLRGVDAEIVRQVEVAPAPALVFVRGPRWPDLASAYYLNAPDFRGRRVVAMSRGPALDRAAAAAYPGHHACMVERGAAPRALEPGGSGAAAGPAP